MEITIGSNKISQGLKDALEANRRPGLCIKLSNGCRIGLPSAFFKYPSPAGDLSRGDWPKLLSSPNVQKVSVMSLTYFCESEPDCNDPRKMVNYRPHVVAKSVDEAISYAGPCEPCKQIGGFPQPKNIVEQLVDGLYKLATTNPAIIACLMVAGPTCPIVAELARMGISWNAIKSAWAYASVKEISNQISQACQALNIKPEHCPTYIAQAIWNEINNKMEPWTVPGPQPTVSQDSIAIYVNDVLVSVIPSVQRPDGSYFVNASLPFVGSVSFSVNFANCSLFITSSGGVLQVGVHPGFVLGANTCQYQIGSYRVVLKLIQSGQTPPPKINGSPKQNDMLVWGALAFAALVAIVLIVQR